MGLDCKKGYSSTAQQGSKVIIFGVSIIANQQSVDRERDEATVTRHPGLRRNRTKSKLLFHCDSQE